MPTRILVVGGGGREHALTWKLASEPGVNLVARMGGSMHVVSKIDRAAGVPGNINSPEMVLDWARRGSFELVVIGPEEPLAHGVVDALEGAGVATFGPTASAARIETSKSFSREIATDAGVPIAKGAAFDEPGAGVAFALDLAARGNGVVVKADGLAAGKGVFVCDTGEEARAALGSLAGAVIVEERLVGREASVVAICDGRDALAMPVARDHKRLLDGDQGPNTGGMGAYSPVPDLSDDTVDDIVAAFHIPVLRLLEQRGTPFRGALYAGLMLTSDGPRLLEFNARFGDPETQVTLPRLASPLGPLLLAAAKGQLRSAMASVGPGTRRLPVLPTAAVGIVLASEGYPTSHGSDERITALDDSGQLTGHPGVLVFHSGTFHESDATFLATGGRVVTVVGQGGTLAEARSVAERAADAVAWAGAQRRHDIAFDAPLPVGAAS